MPGTAVSTGATAVKDLCFLVLSGCRWVSVGGLSVGARLEECCQLTRAGSVLLSRSLSPQEMSKVVREELVPHSLTTKYLLMMNKGGRPSSVTH